MSDTKNNISLFTQQEQEDMRQLVSINAQLKDLESKKKKLSDTIKKSMMAKRVDRVTVASGELLIIESVRNTVTKSTKDNFIAELVGLGRKSLIKTSIEPDVDSILAEVAAGTLDEDMVKRYVKTTPVVTLRCNL